MQSKFYLQAFSEKGFDVMSIIDADELALIKQQDPNPTIYAYSIGHEGSWKPNVLGLGQRQMPMLRDAISKMFNKTKLGLQCFFGHNADNSTNNRKSIGKVVGKTLREIGGVLHNVVAVYIHKEFSSLKLDTCSIEADVHLNQVGDCVEFTDFGEVTGIALGDSSVDKPAFPEAGLLAVVQAFIEREKSMELSEVKKLIKEKGWKVSEIFDRSDLVKDDVVDGLRKDHSQKEFDHRIRVEKHLEEEREKVKGLEEKLKSLEGSEAKIKELTAQVNKSKVSEMIESDIKTRNLNDKQAAFVRRASKNFSIDNFEDEKAIKSSIDDFMKSSLDEMKELGTLFGVEVPEDNNSTPTPPADSGKGGNKDISPFVPDFVSDTLTKA